jgi:radical SAM superfamily enzyme YgiQ (UPF0313 family)
MTMNLLFVSIHIEQSARAVPLGPAMLAAVLDRKLPAVQTDILNLYLVQSAVECAEAILSRNPVYVGFSMYMWNRSLTLEIAEILKERRPEVVLFAGGAEVAMDRAGSFREGPLDFVLPGECEESIVTAMTHLIEGGDPQVLLEDIVSAPIKDLSTLPSPFLDQTLNLDDYSGVLWELSRGCPFRCDFCYESRGESGIRRFPMDRIREELQRFCEAGVDQVFVLDPTFNYDKEMAKTILRLIREMAPDIYFCFEIRSECIDAEMAELFASINCSLQIGLQSASDAVLRNVNRSIDVADFESKILHLHEAGAVYGFDLIYGLPGDTLEGFRHSLDFVMGFIPNHVDLFPLAVLPGTRLQETAPTFALSYQPEAPYQVTSTPEFSEPDMAIASDMAQAFDRFYNRGQAVPWFDIVIRGLGMTPSQFVETLVPWLKTHPSKDTGLIQELFVGELFVQQGRLDLGKLAVDIVNYFNSFEALCEEPTQVPFTYNPLDLFDLLSSGVTDLEEIAVLLPQVHCSATLCLDGDVPSIVVNDSP